MEAQTIVSKTEEYFLCYPEPEDDEELMDYKIRENILATCTTDAQVRTYFATTGNAAMKKPRIDHIILEAIHCLKIQIFRDEHLGLQSYIQLKRTMITMKISKDVGTKNGLNNSTPSKTIYQDVYGLQEQNEVNSLKLMKKTWVIRKLMNQRMNKVIIFVAIMVIHTRVYVKSQ